MNPNKILEDRENRSKEIRKYINDYQVVCLKANIPGDNKQIYLSYLLVKLFSKKILDLYKPIKTIYFDSYDGPYYLFLFDKSRCLKEDMIKIEESYLGRLLDIDVFLDSEISLSRSSPRKCLICSLPARICSRNSTHSLNELLSAIKNMCHEYLYSLIDKLVDESILGELNLTNKFGLVDPNSNGSHKDMDYSLMFAAKESIRPYLLDMFRLGLENDYDLKQLFYKAKEIGIKADEAMFKATNNINCYQGLIFNLG